MYTTTSRLRISPLLGALACMLLSGALAAKDRTVTVSVPVSAQGLDLTQAKDARTFYTRLQNAAWVACTRGDRVNLVPAGNLKGCYETALGDAVRVANAPLITQIYLSGHTLGDAVARGIDVPVQMAGR
jgi:UrcA family protein